MADHVYKILELTGSSTTSSDDAIRNAITKAAKTMRNMHWFQVTETRGHVSGDEIAHWQVTIKVGFTLED
jgi:flavin-binding protein dodecin